MVREVKRPTRRLGFLRRARSWNSSSVEEVPRPAAPDPGRRSLHYLTLAMVALAAAAV
jgi:hypothetical protein